MTVIIDIVDLTGKSIKRALYHTFECGRQEFQLSLDVESGAYIYQVRMEKNNELKYLSSNKMLVNR